MPFFYKESKSKRKKKLFGEGGVGGRGGAFYNPNLKNKKKLFFGRGVGGWGRGGVARVSEFFYN